MDRICLLSNGGEEDVVTVQCGFDGPSGDGLQAPTNVVGQCGRGVHLLQVRPHHTVPCVCRRDAVLDGGDHVFVRLVHAGLLAGGRRVAGVSSEVVHGLRERSGGQKVAALVGPFDELMRTGHHGYTFYQVLGLVLCELLACVGVPERRHEVVQASCNRIMEAL